MSSDTLFAEELLRPVEVVQLELDGPPLRAVYWLVDNERVCLVRCDDGERNVRRIRNLSTLCGTSCEEVARTSAIPPAKMPYCQACVAKAGRGVLR
jgi:hypothetical protein